MAIVTSQQIQTYFDLYRSIEVTLTKEVSSLLGFLQEQIFLKFGGSSWPCILYSTSLEGAKVILNLKADQLERLRTSSNLGSLRYCFRQTDKGEPLTFFVGIRVKGYNRYNSGPHKDLYFMTLEFSQRPPDDLIEIVGHFLEANVNSTKRRDERIPVNEKIIQKIGFLSCSAIISVEHVDRKCLLRDLSFGGAKLILPGIAKFLNNRQAVLKLLNGEDGKLLELEGSFVRVDPVDGRKDLTLAALQFVPESVPQTYKMKINDFLRMQAKFMALKSSSEGTKETP